jgi:hypothetical protein
MEMYGYFLKKKIYQKRNLPKGKILNELLNDYVIGSPTYVIRKKFLKNLEYLFNDNYHIIGDFDINIRMAAKYKVDCVQSPVAYYRKHDKNLSLFNKEKEIQELKTWYNHMKNNNIISQQSNFNKVVTAIHYLEARFFMIKNGFKKNCLLVAKYPLSFNKIKLTLMLFLPKFLLRKIYNY